MTDACERALTRKDLFDMNCYSVPTQFVQSLPTTSCSKVTQASSVCRNAFEKEKKYKGKDIANASASAKSKGQSPVSRPGSHKCIPSLPWLKLEADCHLLDLDEYFSVPSTSPFRILPNPGRRSLPPSTLSERGVKVPARHMP